MENEKSKEKLFYSCGYKYQLRKDFMVQTGIIPPEPIFTKFIDLTATGLLIIREGYASDGPSGPTIDKPKSHVMRGAFTHDALYQLLRLKLLPANFRPRIDKLAYEIWVKDGMWKWRAKIWLRELGKFASFAADPKNVKQIYESP